MKARVDSDSGTLAVAIETMRETAALLLGPDDAPDVLALDQLATLTTTLRDHLARLIPEVEVKAGRLPKDSVERYCARACVGEARRKLSIGDGDTPAVRVSVARKLARSLNALCHHYEHLDGSAPDGQQL